jgi:hypothetical protein
MANVANLALRAVRFLAHSLRFIVGGGLILLGILGVILPVLPGMPFLILGTLVLGRRSRTLRRGSVWGKRALRRWAAHEGPIVGRIGRWGLAAQRDSSRSLRRIIWWLGAQRRRFGRQLRRG